MARFLFTFGLVAALVASAGQFNTGAKADDKKKEETKGAKAAELSPEGKAVEAVAAAYALAGQTDKAGKKSPLLLLAAAKVIGTTEFRELKPGKDDKITSTPIKVDPKEEAGALIQEALELAKDDEAVKAMAAAVRKEIAGFRGGINGPYSFNGRVDSKYDKTDDFYVELRGGQQTRMSVANLSNAGDIDLKVYDLDNRLVAQDTRAAGGAYVQFTPPKNNRYRVVIVLYAGPSKPLNYRFSHN